ncbi:MAG: AAA family ATPase [Deltaproteobacteria bacterium]|nr:AAA family ATPase [Deltaproteobacteria bacterium]
MIRAGRAGREEVFRLWTERDLTAAAAAGLLPAAHEVDELLDRIADVVASRRHPVLVGPSGVGKTAVIGELARRAAEGRGPSALAGKRILQFSIRRHVSALKKPDGIRPAMQELTDALLEPGHDVVPFFRDVDLANVYDLEPHLLNLGARFAGPVLAEGDAEAVRSMFEYTPELEQSYVILEVREPDLELTARILLRWADEQKRLGREFEPGALDEALHLTDRFLARTRMPRKALDLLGQTASVGPAGRAVTGADVIERFSAEHHVPRLLVDPAVPLDLRVLEREFGEKVLGQPEAIRSVAQMIGLIKAGLSDTRRPFGVLLFVGPTGVGKTHVGQLLAERLFGSRDRMIRFNMADYQGEPSAEVLFGDPDDHRPAQRRGVLTQRVAGHSFAVLLLDEFEKAHPKVHDRFLQLVDEGSFINGASEVVSCRSMILVATSNAGAEVYRRPGLGFGGAHADAGGLAREVERRLEQTFRFEFLNRFDRIVHFRPLTREHIRTIAARELEALRSRTGLRRRNVELEVDDVVLDWLAAHGYDPHYGARFLRRTIEREVTTALAEALVRAGAGAATRLALTVRQNRVSARALEPPPPASRRSAVVIPVGRQDEVRSLDRKRLGAEADALLESAAPHLVDLGRRQNEAAALLETMGEAGFWEDRARSREVLERYRALDVAVRIGRRLAEPFERLAELRAQPAGGQDPGRLARAYEAAARALRDWEDRVAEEGPAAVWLVLSNADPLQAAGGFVEELARMELAWCERLGLCARVVAVEAHDGDVTRAALEVEGPGAGAYLAMEQGLHRLAGPAKPDRRVAVDVLPPGDAAEPAPRVMPARKRKGALGLEVTCAGRLEFPERGQVIELCGADRETLGRLLAVLARQWRDAPGAATDVARLYGHDGSGARDPRTGVVATRLKDVLRGDLDRFLDGWRRRVRDAG